MKNWNSTKRGIDMGMSLAWAEIVSSWANGILIGALIAGVIATYGVVISGNVKETALKRDIAAADARAAEANAAAAQAGLELAKFKAPRTLSPEQQSRIEQNLRSFAGTPYDIAIGPMGDPEPLYLARYIHSVLSRAGWKPEDWPDNGMTYSDTGVPRLGVTMVTNVIVDVHPSHWQALGGAATALAEALNANGVDAISDSKPTSAKHATVHIRIGRKM